MGTAAFKAVNEKVNLDICSIAEAMKLNNYEVFRIFHEYGKSLPDAEKMKKEEFNKMFQTLNSPNNTDAFVEAVFNTYDLNEDEEVDFYEVMTGFIISSDCGIYEKLEWVFSLYVSSDLDHVDKHEMVKLLQNLVSYWGKTLGPHVVNPTYKLTQNLYHQFHFDKISSVCFLDFRAEVTSRQDFISLFTEPKIVS